MAPIREAMVPPLTAPADLPISIRTCAVFLHGHSFGLDSCDSTHNCKPSATAHVSQQLWLLAPSSALTLLHLFLVL